MNLVPVNIDSIGLGQPLPFSIRDEKGVLLASKGYMVASRDDLLLMIGLRGNLFVDMAESENHLRAYVGKLHHLVREDKTLGQIADTQIYSSDLDGNRDVGNSGEPDWLDLQGQTQIMLRDSNPVTFLTRLDKLQGQLSRFSRLNPDGTLFALIHLSGSELRLYSATHAMLVSVMCSLAAREVLMWPSELEATLCRAALTMNIGMSDLQDRLALQKEAPNPVQMRQVEQHAARSSQLLTHLGVTDAAWLDAVLHHHTVTSGPLAGREAGQRMARLIQRADIFAARIAPRASRVSDSPAAAMKASYFDENRQIDEAGAALIKAVGIYSPGSFVRLTSNEIAVVIKRSANTVTPRVAVVINRSGMPNGELTVRDTSQAEFRITSSVPHREVKVQINLERLLVLTKLPASDRPW